MEQKKKLRVSKRQFASVLSHLGVDPETTTRVVIDMKAPEFTLVTIYGGVYEEDLTHALDVLKDAEPVTDEENSTN